MLQDIIDKQQAQLDEINRMAARSCDMETQIVTQGTKVENLIEAVNQLKADDATLIDLVKPPGAAAGSASRSLLRGPHGGGGGAAAAASTAGGHKSQPPMDV